MTSDLPGLSQDGFHQASHWRLCHTPWKSVSGLLNVTCTLAWTGTPDSHRRITVTGGGVNEVTDAATTRMSRVHLTACVRCVDILQCTYKTCVHAVCFTCSSSLRTKTCYSQSVRFFDRSFCRDICYVLLPVYTYRNYKLKPLSRDARWRGIHCRPVSVSRSVCPSHVDVLPRGLNYLGWRMQRLTIT